jgi:hypothetical protein
MECYDFFIGMIKLEEQKSVHSEGSKFHQVCLWYYEVPLSETLANCRRKASWIVPHAQKLRATCWPRELNRVFRFLLVTYCFYSVCSYTLYLNNQKKKCRTNLEIRV